MRRGDLAYFDGAKVRSLSTRDPDYAALLVAQLATEVLQGVRAAGLQDNPQVNHPAILRAVAVELERRTRSEQQFERALAAGSAARLRRQNWGFLL